MMQTTHGNGLHHYRRYRYEAARQDFDRAIDLNPNFALAYLWRANTFYEQERFLDMLADEEKAYSLDPMSLEISDQLAFAFLHRDPIIQEWSDRPEYQEILDRNAEQVERQKALYKAGVAARKKADSVTASAGGF